MPIHKKMSETDWEFLNCLGHKFSSNVALHENCYKILHQRYLTPTKMKKMFSGASGICWQRGRTETDFLHVIQPLGENIRFRIQEMLGIRVPFNVLHDFQKWKQGKR